MKKIISLFTALLLLSSCSKDSEQIEQLNPEAKECVVSIKVGGEILDITEGPLTKAPGDDLYGFKVYTLENGKYESVAVGLFNDISNVSVKLIKGKKYKIISTMIRDGMNVVFHEGDFYNLPFSEYFKTGFEYTDPGYNYYPKDNYRLGETLLSVPGSKNDFTSSNIPSVYRYYGETGDVVCDENTSFSIDMKKMIFGLKYVVEGLKAGSVDFRLMLPNGMDLGNGKTIKFGEAQEVEDIHTFYDFRDLAALETGVGYILRVTHTRGDGIVEEIAKQEVVFKRNKKTTVVVKIKESASETVTKGNSVAVKLEESLMTDGDIVTIG